MRERHYAQLRAAAKRALGPDADVELVDDHWRAADEPRRTPAKHGFRDDNLNPKYTFEQFVIGDGNRLAHAAALAVAEMPAQAYNPLFIYGRPGLGKTHLLQAIGNYVTLYGGGLRVRYATVEEFTSDFVRSIQKGDASGFRDRFRGVDVLLLDDVQFLADKVKTKEEFFHTFNALYEGGRQLVLTSDRAPVRPRRLRDAPRASASPPASSPTSSLPSSTCAWPSCASAPSSTRCDMSATRRCSRSPPA